MDPHDRAAMAAAIAMMRADSEQRDLLDHVLNNQSEPEAGLFAVGFCQIRNLKLRPWEAPPCDTRDVQTSSDVYGARASEVRLLRRMIELGISRYEPDPLKAIARIEPESAA